MEADKNYKPRVTEQPSQHRHLEKMTIEEITRRINEEDKKVPYAVEKALPQLNNLIQALVHKLKKGGRLFYLGAGSGGRLSVLDAIEMPTTYGVKRDLFNVILAGGVERLVEALEEKEDDTEEGPKELIANNVNEKDFVIGISASGTTPFVLESLKFCWSKGIATGCIVSNPSSEIAALADFPVEVITGPEFITGSTRMKCGTAQKMIFDMISTTTMIQLGRVEDNNMIYVSLINNKTTDRAVKILMKKASLDNYEEAKQMLLQAGSVKKALAQWQLQKK